VYSWRVRERHSFGDIHGSMSDHCIFSDAGDGTCRCDCGRVVAFDDCSRAHAYHLNSSVYKLPKKRTKVIRKGKPASATTCPHLLDPTGENVRLKGCGCGAETAIYECDLHQLCAPIPRTKRAEIIGDDRVIRFCKDCPDNPANPSASRPAAV
jgi:hypothetical protein